MDHNSLDESTNGSQTAFLTGKAQIFQADKV
jgi:hypothetical protein